jgi:hypothetical protein
MASSPPHVKPSHKFRAGEHVPKILQSGQEIAGNKPWPREGTGMRLRTIATLSAAQFAPESRNALRRMHAQKADSTF